MQLLLKQLSLFQSVNSRLILFSIYARKDISESQLTSVLASWFCVINTNENLYLTYNFIEYSLYWVHIVTPKNWFLYIKTVHWLLLLIVHDLLVLGLFHFEFGVYCIIFNRKRIIELSCFLFMTHRVLTTNITNTRQTLSTPK